MKNRLMVGLGAGISMGVVFVTGFLVLNTQGINALGLFGGNDSYFSKAKVNSLGEVIKAHYIDGIEDADFVEGIYKGYVSGLGDSGTKYLPADQFRKIEEEEAGNYLGSGIRFTWGITQQYMIITEVIEGSMAEKEGIKVGDKVIALDGVPAMASNELEVYEKLLYSGEAPVIYTITDNNGSNERDVALIAEVLEFDTVISELVEDEIGFIEIRSLVEGTTNEIKNHMDQLIEDGASKFILDLRGTSNTDVNEVVMLTDLFLDEEVIFSVKSYQDEEVVYQTANGKYDEELVVLANTLTSGPVEAFVATIKTSERGIIIGRETAGKATTQENVPLEDGSGLVITTGYIVMPDGTMIREEGIMPHITQLTSSEATLELVTTGELPLLKDDVIRRAVEALK